MKFFFAVILILVVIFGLIAISDPSDPVSDPVGTMIGYLTLFGLPGILLLLSDIQSRITKKKPRRGHIILIFSFSIFVFSTVLAIHSSMLSKPVIAKNAPAELVKMENSMIGNELARNGLIACRSKPIDINVVYRHEIKSLNSYWYGSNAVVEIDGRGSFTGKPGFVKKCWGDSIHHQGNFVPNGDPKPYFEATIKVDPKNLHKKLKIKATMDVTYPQDVSGGFTNAYDWLKKEFTVYVVTQAELIQSEQLHDYRDRHATTGGFIVFGICSLLAVGFVIYKRWRTWA